MVFHCLSVPYAATRKEISLCAFVQKVYKFCNEMTRRGHTVYHYGHENSEVACTEHITVTNDEILKKSYKNPDAWKESGFNQDVSAEAFKIFNENCVTEINKRLKSNKEFILCWFGFGHELCVRNFYDKAIVVEPSIGYDSMFAPVKMFETHAQLHKMHGIAQNTVNFGREYVVYPGFDPNDFIYKKEKSETALFLGRIIESKGAKLAYDICNEVGQEIIFAGPNIMNLPDTKYCKFIGFIEPNERKLLLSNAKFLFAPSLFIEPCNWTAIESQFSGTPVVSTDFGGFTETISQAKTGIRCLNPETMIFAIKNINKIINPVDCYNHAVSRFTLKQQCDYYEVLFNNLTN